MSPPREKLWTTERIESELRPVIEKLGRMPTTGELRRGGLPNLCRAVSTSPRRFAGWAAYFGVKQSGGNTHRGQEAEAQTEKYLKERGFDVVRQGTKDPFDLLVSNRIRIDVKSAKYGEYSRASDGNIVRGHVFGNLHPIPQCDLYVLCGVDPDNRILWRYFVPASEARIQTLTITPTGQRYARFKEALSELERMVRESEAA